MTKIVAIAGSPSHPSRSYAVLEAAQTLLQNHNIAVDIISVRDIPAEVLLYAQFNDPALLDVVARIEQADALIISTPIYKAAYTGVLKALLDLLPQKALVNKPVLPIATGGTLAHLLAVDYALKPVLNALGAEHVLAGVYLVDSQFQRLETGGVGFNDPELAERFNRAIEALAQAVTSGKVPAAV